MRSTSWTARRTGLRQWTHQLGAFALLSLSAVMAAGCGGGARADFQLNTGEATAELDSTQAAEFAALFPTLQQLEQRNREQGDDSYHVVAGDQLEVVFFTHPEQNRFVKVRPDGRITMPFLGDVQAAGRSPMAIAQELQGRYSEVLVKPRVDVLVHSMGGRFYVLGQVQAPGEYVYERAVNVVQGLARAGGYADSARLSNIVLLRKNAEGHTYAAIFDFRDFMGSEGRAGNIALQPYDIVWVPRSALARFDNAARKALVGVINAEKAAIDGWSLVNFEDVFQRRFQ